MLTKSDLIAFEDDIAADFNAGKIKSPVHLAGGNETELLDVFAGIKARDWVLCAWRAHYHCLLKGVPPAEVKAAIHAGRSIALCFPAHRILCSAIVGGICPIAVGIAWAIKRRNGDEGVHVFVGDMTAESGIYHESAKYAARHNLPIRWVIEDNGKSVMTDTQAVWGTYPNVTDANRYRYQMDKPHVGTGHFVRF
jgi:pyruvate dehydrogenase E1 component alpha subunit